MWIKRLYATFGKLDNKSLELKNGLNIVCGGNEAGKSTWGAFIRTMLYGISTRERPKSGYIPDKDRYKPWNGSEMYGRAEIFDKGENIIIERKAGRSGVFSSAHAYKADTGESVETGASLTGVEQGTYLRTAFIGQAGMRIDGNSDMEKRILAATTSGDESVSATDVLAEIKKRADMLLPAKKKDIGIPKLRAEESALAETLSDVCETEEKIDKTAELLKSARERASQLERCVKIAEFEEKKEKYKLREDAQKALESAEKEKAKTESYPTRETEGKIRAFERALERARLEEESAENALGLQSAEKETAEQAAGDSVFSGMDRDEARKAAESAKKKKISPAVYIMLACSVLLLAVGVFFAVSGNFVILIAWAVHGIATLFTAIASKGAGNPEMNELSLSEYFGALDSLERANGAYGEKKRILEEMTLARKNAEGAVKNSLLGAGIFEDDAEKAMAELSRRVSERERAERAYLAAESRYSAISDAIPDDVRNEEYQSDEIPQESAEELKKELLTMRGSVREYEIELARLSERVSGISKAETEKKLYEVRTELSEAEFSYSAASLALEVMELSANEIKNRFSPELEKRTAEIFKNLTGGSFDVVRIGGSDFNMSVAEKTASAPRDVLLLSGGTYDELYFSLRLALCDMIFGEDEIPPIILDDSFVNFDASRMSRALELLSKRAERGQIILFTCHTREAEYMKARKDINIVNI